MPAERKEVVDADGRKVGRVQWARAWGGEPVTSALGAGQAEPRSSYNLNFNSDGVERICIQH